MEEPIKSWRFVDDEGTFELENPQATSGLFFPLVNEAGLMSAVSPTLHGDIKTGQNSFLTPPASIDDLHNTRLGRNFWVRGPQVEAWSAAGASAAQMIMPDETKLRAGLLYQTVTRRHPNGMLEAEVTSFVPHSPETVECLRVRLTNTGAAPLELTTTAAIPIFGRSADNLRDHRHVTSLLHRITTFEYGVLVRPALSFDERGHQPNELIYAVLGVEAGGQAPAGFFPLQDEFVGEGGTLDWPAAVAREDAAIYPAGAQLAGREALGGLRFAPVTLSPGETAEYIVLLAVLPAGQTAQALVEKYGSGEKFERWLEITRRHWLEVTALPDFHSGDPDFDRWLRWVRVQPVLRRLFGNSFLPFHDYGRGGRGWRDLWQDCLALLMMAPEEVPELLYSNFAGVRFDGSNATIIGSRPGEFKADRNDIPRAWMDHGAWPLLTVDLYVQSSGDLAFLLRPQAYFKDGLALRSRGRDERWDPVQGTQLRTAEGAIYQGSLLEHLLVQHLTAFFNAGEHNTLRLEDADWNDALDMAAGRGESVAFSALYAGNLLQLAKLVEALERQGVTELALAEELALLLDTVGEGVDYESPSAKRARLQAFMELVAHTVTGRQVRVPASALADDLRRKGEWLAEHIRRQEWVESQEGYAWFNGYYNNDGRRVEGDHPGGARMTLTGQVFALMAGVASEAQARQMIRAADHYLLDERLGGHRLNTDFKEVLLNLGRCFGFAYGTKENGAVFSHMAVMYAQALYARGFGREGYRVLDRLYRQCCDFERSRMYPGLPEYFDPRGRGQYTYLTGSASWYLLALLAQAYGVRGELGDLLLAPQLVAEQFDAQGEARVRARVAGRRIEVCYRNPQGLEPGAYRVAQVALDGEPVDFRAAGRGAVIEKRRLEALDEEGWHRIEVQLAPA